MVIDDEFRSKVRTLFAKKLKPLREFHGYEQTEIAKEVGLSPGGYAHYEKGRAIPSAEVLIALCELLETTPNTLLGFTDSGRLESICRKYDIRCRPVAVNRNGDMRPLIPGSAIHLASAKVLMADWEAKLHEAEEMVRNAENEDALKQAKKEKERIKKERPTEEFLQRRDAQRAAAMEEDDLHGEVFSDTHVCVLRPMLADIEEVFTKSWVIVPWAIFESVLFNLQNRIDMLAMPGEELCLFQKLLYCQLLLWRSKDEQFSELLELLSSIREDAIKEIRNPLKRQVADAETRILIQQYKDVNDRVLKMLKRGQERHEKAGKTRKENTTKNKMAKG